MKGSSCSCSESNEKECLVSFCFVEGNKYRQNSQSTNRGSSFRAVFAFFISQNVFAAWVMAVLSFPLFQTASSKLLYSELFWLNIREALQWKEFQFV
jgi:hypothetical protein